MLGHVRRTTKLDVGLALAFSGLAYLVWSLVAGVSRMLMSYLIRTTQDQDLPAITDATKLFFHDTGFVIDVAGLLWLVLSLALILLASRQLIGISWAWLSAICQAMAAGLGAVLVAWAAFVPFLQNAGNEEPSTGATISRLSLPLVVAIAIFLWVVTLVWLLVERSRLNRRGPTLTDGLRTNR